jgi:subtilisin family serine protease
LYTVTGVTGKGVHVFVVDSGIYADHVDFRGDVGEGYAAEGHVRDWDDCDGHGTHVAATVGGETYGVAKGVTLHAVKVLSCDGSGTMSRLIAGLQWVYDSGLRSDCNNNNNKHTFAGQTE